MRKKVRPIERKYRRVDNVRVGPSILHFPELLKRRSEETYVPEREYGGEG